MSLPRGTSRAYFAPPVVIILALITLAVAATLIINTKLFPKPKETPAQVTQATLESPVPVPDSEDGGTQAFTCESLRHQKFVVECPSDWQITYKTKPIPSEEVEDEVEIKGKDGTIMTFYRRCYGCFEINVPAKELEIFVNGEKKKAFEVYSEENGIKMWWLTGSDNSYFKFDVNKTPSPSDKEKEQILRILSTFQFID